MRKKFMNLVRRFIVWTFEENEAQEYYINLRVSSGFLQRMNKLKEKTGNDKSEIIRQALQLYEDALNEHEKGDDFFQTESRRRS